MELQTGILPNRVGEIVNFMEQAIRCKFDSSCAKLESVNLNKKK